MSYGGGGGGGGGHSGGSSRGGGIISAAVFSKHSFEERPVDIPFEEMEPQIIEVEGNQPSIEIHFKSSSSRIKVKQTHESAGAGETEQTSSEEEPHRLVRPLNNDFVKFINST